MKNSEKQSIPQGLGKLIRKKRNFTGMTLRELSRRSGLTASFISQVENGRSQLSLSSLEKISRGLRLPITDLMTSREQQELEEKQEPEVFLVRSGSGPRMFLPDRNITSEFLTPNLGGGLEVISSKGHRSSGNTARQLNIYKKEVIYILEGTVRIDIEATSHELHTGDSIYYAGAELTGFYCITETARWLSIIAYNG